MSGRGLLRLLAGRENGGEVVFGCGLHVVEFAVPDVARERAEEIVRLSRDYSDHGAGFRSPREVFGPALLYGLAHMHERYSAAALERRCEREARGVLR